MAYRKVYSNFASVSWGGTAITGVEEIGLSEAASRVSAGADNELHESVQFMGMRTTQIDMTLQEAPPFSLSIVNNGLTDQLTLAFTIKGRMNTADKYYIIENVQWFDLRQNGAFGNMRRWTMTGHAVTDTGDSTPVTVVS